MGRSEDVVIRSAVPGDARAVAEVHVRSWQAAYRGQIPERILDGLSVDRREVMWRGQLEAEPDLAGWLWVAERDGTVVGFASAGPTRDEDLPPDETGELYAIYLHPDWWGHGIGQRLLRRVTEELERQGYREGCLWVLSTNARTRRFYELAGWRADGAEKVEAIDGFELLEVRYRRALQTESHRPREVPG